ncbi:MAG: GNAT family N-acetyltransferase [Tumebacillaceae bacterium]
MFKYRLVDPNSDQAMMVDFFVDAGNGEEDYATFDAAEYLEFAKSKAEAFPEGFLFAEVDGDVIGELVLRMIPYEERTIGYVSLIYLKPDYRGQGYSQEMFAHAEKLFREHGLSEYHLRVSVNNDRAIRFYEKQGMINLGQEYNSHQVLSYRMCKQL